MTETQKSKKLASINDCVLSDENGIAIYKPAGQNLQVQNGNAIVLHDRHLTIVVDGAPLRHEHASADKKAVTASCNGKVGSLENTDAFSSGETEETAFKAGASVQPTPSYNGIAALCRRVLKACEKGSLSCLSDQNRGALGDKGLAILLKEISAILEDPKPDGLSLHDGELDTKPAVGDFAGKEIAVEVKVPRRYGLESAGHISTTTIQRKSELPKLRNNLLLDLPYNVRQEIYSFYYAVNRNIQLTDGPPEWNALMPRRGSYHMTTEGLNLLRTCRQLNDEIVALVYGKNTFLLAPGERDYPRSRVPNRPPVNTELFLLNLRISTKQTLKNLYLCLGPCMRYRLINKLCANLGQIPRVVMTVDPLNQASLIPISKTKQRQRLRESCRKIALARATMPLGATLWDDCGDAATARMLYSAMPDHLAEIAWMRDKLMKLGMV